MLIQIQPNTFSCLITSFAIVLGTPVKKLIDEIGHDGSEIWWPNADEPMNKRGFHLQEIVDCCYKRGYTVTTIEPRPVLHSPELNQSKEIVLLIDIHKRLSNYMSGNIGVLTGLNSCNNRHAIAWIENQAFDPATGKSIDLNVFSIQYFYLLNRNRFSDWM
jgi:hypothetical protein